MLFDTKAFGFRVKMLRKCSGLTQEQLSEKLHISISHLAKIEIGRNAPSIDLLLEMSELFGVNTDELLRGNGGQGDSQPMNAEAVLSRIAALLADFSVSGQQTEASSLTRNAAFPTRT